MPSVSFVVRRAIESHHARFAGYSRLVDYYPSARIHEVTDIPLGRFGRLALHHGKHMGLVPMGYVPISGETAPTVDSDVIHHLYGENTFFLTAFRPRKRRKVVLTIHQPMSWYTAAQPDAWWRRRYSRADLIICLTQAQADCFRAMLATRVEFVPHGVDRAGILSRSAVPSPTRFTSRVCLSVGGWMRDHDLLAAAINRTTSKGIRFRIVASQAQLRGLLAAIHPERRFSVETYHGISDDELLELYATSALMVLPLKDGTANNAALEAMVAGLPILATGAAPPKDYLHPQGSEICPPDANLLASTIAALVDDPSRLAAMGGVNASHVRRFEWTAVANTIRELHRSVT